MRRRPSRWIWPGPQYGTPAVREAVRLRTAARATSGVDVVVLGDDVAGLVRVLWFMNSTARAPGADHGADEVAFLGRHVGRGDADDVVERRQHVARDGDGAILVLELRPERLGDRRHRRPGRHRAPRRLRRSRRSCTSSASAGCRPPFCEQQHGERLARRARVGVADLVALEILERLDRRIRLHRPDELGDGQHVVADDLEIGALLDGGRR